MGFIDQMFGGASIPGLEDDADGSDGTCRIARPHYDATYTVSGESHDVAYAVPVTAADLDALSALVETEREAPLDGVDEGADAADEALGDVLEGALADEDADVDGVVDRVARPRRQVAALLDAWRALLGEADTGVGYLPIGVTEDVVAFVALCRERDRRVHDGFVLPEEMERVVSLLDRIETATDRPENRVVVNRRHLPELT